MNTEQFSRISLLIGEDNVNKLFNSSVLIVGLGAVGGMALEALVRSGVSHLTLIDFDTVSVSNINRQIKFKNRLSCDRCDFRKTEHCK